MSVQTILVGAMRTADNNDELSRGLWRKCPLDEFRSDRSKGYIFQPDIFNTPVFATTVSQMGLITLQDTGVTIQGDPAQVGVLAWGGQDADNDCGAITGAGGTGTVFNISSADPRELWYEIRIKKSSIGNNSMGFFAGLTEEAMNAATNTLLATDTAALADKDFIGFHVDQADGASVDFVYNKAGGGGITIKIAAVATMVADTWLKLGFFYSPTQADNKKIRIYKNNIEQSAYITQAQYIAATFPDGEELTPTIVGKKGEATISTMKVSQWCCAQRLRY